MSELHWMTVGAAARAIAAKELSPVDLTKALLDRIDTLDPRLNAFIRVDGEAAMAAALAAETEAQSGRLRGPLHGVPVGIKDIIDVAGLPTTCHSKVLQDNMASADAVCVEKLRGAGAIVLGKLSTHEFAIGGPSFDLPWPPARNPWNTDHHPGGSSSGSGSGVAAGLFPMALGTDTGGSVRNPASCCGIVGLKPTYGLVSRRGVFPLSFTLDHVGPMTRSALDAAIVLGVIAGADPADPTAVGLPVPDYAAGIDAGVRGKRIGLATNMHGLDADAQRALEDAVAAFRTAGASIVDVKLPANFDQGSRDWVPLCAVEAAVAHEGTYPSRASEYGPVLSGLLDQGLRLSATDLAKMQLRRAALTGDLNKLLASVDLLLMPVMGRAVWSTEALQAAGRDPETVASRLRYTAPFDLSGHPTLTLPGGMTADGVPVGFQIVARAFEEESILAAGHAYQQRTDWHLKRPPL